MSNIIDRFACRVAIWALTRVYGCDCPTFIWDDFPAEGHECLSCYATKLKKHMREYMVS